MFAAPPHGSAGAKQTGIAASVKTISSCTRTDVYSSIGCDPSVQYTVARSRDSPLANPSPWFLFAINPAGRFTLPASAPLYKGGAHEMTLHSRCHTVSPRLTRNLVHSKQLISCQFNLSSKAESAGGTGGIRRQASRRNCTLLNGLRMASHGLLKRLRRSKPYSPRQAAPSVGACPSNSRESR